MTVPTVTQDRNAYRFRTEVRVRLSETDAVGIVFFGSYAAYMDVGRMDYLENLGLTRLGGPVRDLIPGAVVSHAAEFHAPARYNDAIEINVRIASVGHSSYTFHFLLANRRSAEVVASGQLTLVWLDRSFRPMPMPADFRDTITSFERDNLDAPPDPA